MTNGEITLTLKTEEVDALLMLLAEHPYKTVSGLIGKIANTAMAQTNAGQNNPGSSESVSKATK